MIPGWPIIRPLAWGHTTHGLVIKDQDDDLDLRGYLVLPSGETIQYPLPETGQTTYCRRPNASAVNRTSDEQVRDAANGDQWRNDLILAGRWHQLYRAPMPLGANVLCLPECEENRSWLLKVAISSSVLTVTRVSRFGRIPARPEDTQQQVLLSTVLSDPSGMRGTTWQYLQPEDIVQNPSGLKILVHRYSLSGLEQVLEITVSCSTAGTPISASVLEIRGPTQTYSESESSSSGSFQQWRELGSVTNTSDGPNVTEGECFSGPNPQTDEVSITASRTRVTNNELGAYVGDEDSWVPGGAYTPDYPGWSSLLANCLNELVGEYSTTQTVTYLRGLYYREDGELAEVAEERDIETRYVFDNSTSAQSEAREETWNCALNGTECHSYHIEYDYINNTIRTINNSLQHIRTVRLRIDGETVVEHSERVETALEYSGAQMVTYHAEWLDTDNTGQYIDQSNSLLYARQTFGVDWFDSADIYIPDISGSSSLTYSARHYLDSELQSTSTIEQWSAEEYGGPYLNGTCHGPGDPTLTVDRHHPRLFTFVYDGTVLSAHTKGSPPDAPGSIPRVFSLEAPVGEHLSYNPFDGQIVAGDVKRCWV